MPKQPPKPHNQRKKPQSSAEPDLSHIQAGLRPLAMPLADLVPDQGNSRTHDSRNLAAIVGSLRQFGQTQAIVARRDSLVICAGHGRVLAAQQLYAGGDLRWAYVAVLLVDWDPVTGVAYQIADNRTAELADWDKAALEKQLRAIEVSDEELQKMNSELAEELELIVVDDDVEEPAAVGDIPEKYQLLVELPDESGQRQLLERLEQEGYKCRALIS